MNTQSQQQDIDQYFLSLSEKERNAYKIAESHLGSLFTIEKTAGFQKWKNTQSSSISTTTK
jgi:hypothetical protein